MHGSCGSGYSLRGVVWCGVVWCGVVWCGVGVCGVRCGVVWGVVCCGVVCCGVGCAVLWCEVWCGVVWCGVRILRVNRVSADTCWPYVSILWLGEIGLTCNFYLSVEAHANRGFGTEFLYLKHATESRYTILVRNPRKGLCMHVAGTLRDQYYLEFGQNIHFCLFICFWCFHVKKMPIFSRTVDHFCINLVFFHNLSSYGGYLSCWEAILAVRFQVLFILNILRIMTYSLHHIHKGSLLVGCLLNVPATC